MTGPTLFELKPLFDGPGLEPFDIDRLNGQMRKAWDLMSDGQYRSLRTIAASIGSSEAGASARMRDFRKQKFGAHSVVRRRVGEGRGTFEYKLIPRGSTP